MQTLHSDPSSRFDSSGELADHLTGLLQQSQALSLSDGYGPFGRSLTRHPLQWLIAAAIVPHICASVLQTLYNIAVILETMSVPAQDKFKNLLWLLNLAIYGPCIAISLQQIHAALGSWRNHQLDRHLLEASRVKLLRIPATIAIIGTLGWLIGAISYPSLIHLFADPLPAGTWSHFFFSFGFACAIAVTYAYALMYAVIVIGYYPAWHGEASQFRRHAVAELAPIRDRWRRLTWFAGVIPLSAAVLLILTHEEPASGELSVAFRVLMISLIAAGAIGFALMELAGRLTVRVIDRCLGAETGG